MSRGKKCAGRNKKLIIAETSRNTPVALAVFAAIAASATAMADPLEEIIVTAQRRSESVIDVPYNISAISAESIRNSGATTLEDALRLVPGLAFDNTGPMTAKNNMRLRGVNFESPSFTNEFQDLTDAPVSMYIGEIPLFTKIRMTDIERIEVLRGPQGTLYGSGSVGGTVKILFNKPDTKNSVFDIHTRFSANAHSDELNYSADAVGNLPISDDFAIRVAVGYNQNGGIVNMDGAYALGPNQDPAAPGGFPSEVLGNLPPVPLVEQPLLSDPADPDSAPIIRTLSDVDDFETWYVRGSGLWNVSDTFAALATWFHQEDDGFGDQVSGIRNDDPQDRTPWSHLLRRGNQKISNSTDVFSVELSVDLGFATVTSATGYSDVEKSYYADLSALYQELDDADFGIFPGFGSYGGFPRLTGPSPQREDIRTLTQEIRLVTDAQGRWDSVVGIYYEDTNQDVGGYDLWPGYFSWLQDPATAVSIAYGTPSAFETLSTVARPDLGYAFTLFREVDFVEKAMFGELTLHISDKWQLTGGARIFWQNFEQRLFNQLPICGEGCGIIGNPIDGIAADDITNADFQDQIFKINTSYDLYDNHKVYFTWSEGFRHGGANPFPASGPGGVPPQFLIFQADKATNYEAGLKGVLSDGRLRYAAAVYRIDWDKPQTDGFFGPFALPAVINAEEARTQGIEAELTAAPNENMLVSLGYNYVDAEFTKGALSLAGLDANFASIQVGDRMPGVPKHMASWAVDFFQPLAPGREIHANVNGSLRTGTVTFPNSTFRDFAELDGFQLWNASIEWRNETWSIGAFVNNIGDEEAATGARIGNPNSFDDRAFVGRPRHYGVFVNYSFLE